MSLIRASLVTIQALSNGLACTPPNPTSAKQRYHTEEMYILQIAPLIFKCHQIICYLCALFEVLTYLLTLLPSSLSSPLTPVLCPASAFSPLTSPSSLSLSSFSTSISTTTSLSQIQLLRSNPVFITGVALVLLGTYIRLDCFSTLGELFTFDLTVHPSHRLVTDRFYSYVRHPAYTGSILLVIGLALSHLTRGSWLAECGFALLPSSYPSPSSSSSSSSLSTGWLSILGLTATKARIVVWATWWVWTLCVGVSRADAEDRQMHKLFGKEWEGYRARVGWWFVPGVL